MSVFFFFMFFIFISPFFWLEVETTDCNATRCKKNGPLIQFPFRNKDLHPQNCGFPGFDVHCDTNQETALFLPTSVKVFIRKIDYVSQIIHIYDPQGCLPQNLPNLNLSASPFNFFDGHLDNYTLFNCSAGLEGQISISPIFCPGIDGYQVYAAGSNTDSFGSTSCTKIHGIWSVPWSLISGRNAQLNWTEPACGQCESQRKLCSLRNNSTGGNQIECTNKPEITQGSSKTPLIAALAGLYHLYSTIRAKKYNQVKIEKFLEDYKALKPTRFSYADIRRITNQFTEKLGEGGYGIVYKGKLSKEIDVAVKVLHNSTGNGEEFINEVGTIGTIHHVNVVRLVGFCAEGFKRALVYDFLPNDSLEKFIFPDGPKKKSLCWEKLENIALGIAKGIEYLHQGCDQQILHFDIKPHNILLDHNCNPKICDFGLAKFCSKEQSAVSMTAARGTMGYIAPEVLSRTFGRVSYKSDVYSFGMLLLEMVGGRRNVDVTMHTSRVYFPRWIYNHLSEGGEIFVEIEDGDEFKIVRKLTVVGLCCIQWCPNDRPSMKTVVQMLEGDGDDLTIPPNPFPATHMMNSIEGMTGRGYEVELAVITELE
ncbi:hypothetical protein ACJIZ3_022675 [Penstemon smallii]|uniref:Protein kinase domain-containing protein n=1 Tax=Penstemon smallii TaxID=265156 RepID=A0ABD3TLZ9_9LAMI